MNAGHQAKLEERASDRGMPISVSMRHAFVPFTGNVTDDGFELLIAVGMVFKALITALDIHNGIAKSIYSPTHPSDEQFTQGK